MVSESNVIPCLLQLYESTALYKMFMSLFSSCHAAQFHHKPSLSSCSEKSASLGSVSGLDNVSRESVLLCEGSKNLERSLQKKKKIKKGLPLNSFG